MPTVSGSITGAPVAPGGASSAAKPASPLGRRGIIPGAPALAAGASCTTLGPVTPPVAGAARPPDAGVPAGGAPKRPGGAVGPLGPLNCATANHTARLAATRPRTTVTGRRRPVHQERTAPEDASAVVGSESGGGLLADGPGVVTATS